MPSVQPKKPSSASPAATPDPVAPPPVRPSDAVSTETIEKAKDLLAQNKNEEALRVLKDLVAQSPSRAARKYLLHAATRTHNWQTAVAQVPSLEPFKLGEEVTMFYAAVALYQAGKVADARPLLERSLPGINPSPYVDSYKQKILGH
jgi:tetratricopeptide (TPR) repeat protein